MTHRATYGQPLTNAEKEALRLVALGRSNPQIASALYIGHDTVKTRLKHAFQKLGAVSRCHAVLVAVHRGELPCPCPEHDEAAELVARPVVDMPLPEPGERAA